MVARCSFLGWDRLDIEYAAKEASRWMSEPCLGDYEHITPDGKFLNGGIRPMEQAFLFGSGDGAICACSDSD